jgi:hypothetical protein
LTSSVAFSLTASDIHHARLYCSLASPPATIALQLFPHRARLPCTPSSCTPRNCSSLSCTAPPSPIAGPAFALALSRRTCAPLLCTPSQHPPDGVLHP